MKGLEKIWRYFWNNKGEEVCRDKILRKWFKIVFYGVIDILWILKKIVLLVMEVNKIFSEKKRKFG